MAVFIFINSPTPNHKTRTSMQELLKDASNPHPLQPDLMNRIYRYQRFFYDASRKYYLLGRDQLIHALRPGAGDHVLELGCGTGRNLIKAARHYPAARFHGLDISTEMLKTAGNNIYRAGLTRSIRLASADASTFDGEAIFAQSRFQRIFISFSLSMIPAWQQTLQTAQDHLSPGGELHIVDFGNCESWPAPMKAGLYGWLALFHVHPLEGFAGQLKEAAINAGNHIEIKKLYGGYSVRAVIRRPDEKAPATE